MKSDTAALADERLKPVSALASLLRRPELGAIAGLVVVVLFFLLTADAAMFTMAGFINFMTPAAQLGILALGATVIVLAWLLPRIGLASVLRMSDD